MPSFTLQGYLNFINTTNPTTMRSIKIIKRGISIGLKTHNHDQVITPHNFNTTKATNNNVRTPGP